MITISHTIFFFLIEFEKVVRVLRLLPSYSPRYGLFHNHRIDIASSVLPYTIIQRCSSFLLVNVFVSITIFESNACLIPTVWSELTRIVKQESQACTDETEGNKNSKEKIESQGPHSNSVASPEIAIWSWRLATILHLSVTLLNSPEEDDAWEGIFVSIERNKRRKKKN